MPPITLRQQITELKRELTMRSKVYPAMVARGTLPPREAERRTAHMAAALATLEHVAEERFKAEAAPTIQLRR